MNESDRALLTVRHTIALRQIQLAVLPQDDPRYATLCRKLLCCYCKVLTLLRRRSATERARLAHPHTEDLAHDTETAQLTT